MTRFTVLLGSCISLFLLTNIARTEESAAIPLPVLKLASPAEQSDGTLSEAAARAIEQGPLPFSDADVAAKAAANRASGRAMQSAMPSYCKSVIAHSYSCR